MTRDAMHTGLRVLAGIGFAILALALPFKDLYGLWLVGIHLFLWPVALLALLGGCTLGRGRAEAAAALAFLALCLLAAWNSMAREYSLFSFGKEALLFVSVFLAVLAWGDTPTQRAYMLRTIGLVAVVVAACSLRGYWHDIRHGDSEWVDYQNYDRAKGTIGSYGKLSLYFVLTLPLLASLLIRSLSRRAWAEVAVWTPGLLLALVTLFLTYSRGAWAAAGLGLVILCSQRREGRLLLAVVVALLLAVAMASPRLRDRIGSFTRDRHDMNMMLSGRQSLWKTGWTAFCQHPATGVGYGPMIFWQKPVKSQYPLVDSKPESQVHNNFLEMACETGAPGFLAFYGLQLLVAWRVLQERPWRSSNDDPRRAIILACATALVCINFYGIVSTYHAQRIGMLFWMILGLLCASTAHPDDAIPGETT